MRNLAFLKALLDDMTLEEKIGQMLQLLPTFHGEQGEDVITGPMAELGIDREMVRVSGSVLGATEPNQIIAIQKNYLEKSRLKIPLLFMFDVVHGYRTIFPIPLALSCTWEPETMRRMAEISGKEAAVSGIHVTFAPVADLIRDPRWGRVMESTGEDPYLNALYAAAAVRGYQENTEKEYNISACIKHFAAYGACQAGRDYHTVDMSDWMLREYYLPAYRAAVEAGCDLVMASFNTVHGIPSTGNSYLLREILRDEWGFEGVTISDWASVDELIFHGIAQDHEQSAELAVHAGVDIEMMTANYPLYLKKLVESGIVDEKLINESVLRILVLKNKRGLFENPFGAADADAAANICLCPAHRQAAKEAAAKACVLLKNDGILPLKKGQRIALIGPFAKCRDILGGWRALGKKEDVVSLYCGLSAMVGQANITYAQGLTIMGDEAEDFSTVEAACMDADVIVLALGEEQDMSGEAASRAFLTLPGKQEQLIRRLAMLQKPMVAVLFNGRPLEIRSWLEEVGAVLEAWFPGTEGGNAIAELLLGHYSPQGRLTMSFPYTVGQIPVYYNSFSTGRPKNGPDDVRQFVSKYLDIPNEPLFPFGFGLTYTAFTYGPIHLDAQTLSPGGILKASLTIENIGAAQGCETVQLYLRDEAACIVRPLLELKAFQKVMLMPGEMRCVTFELCPDMLLFHNADGQVISQPGAYTLMIGPNAAEYRTAQFILTDLPF